MCALCALCEAILGSKNYDFCSPIGQGKARNDTPLGAFKVQKKSPKEISLSLPLIVHLVSLCDLF